MFGPSSNNLEIFEESILPAVDQSLQGFNSSVMLYGVTGAGKTHTVFGSLGYKDPFSAGEYEPGLVYHAMKRLMAASGVSIQVTYVEIYNEQVKDLLGVEDNLAITETPSGEVVVPGAQSREVHSFSRMLECVKEGNGRRKTAKTNANAFSSRSHAVLQVLVRRSEAGRSFYSKVSFIDLAGSERAASTLNKGVRLAEGGSINKSLLALGKVIARLSDGSGEGFVPYRDSKLTRLLKDSLGGNTRTVLVACVGTSRKQADETIHSLNYASRAKKIKLMVRPNSVLEVDFFY